MLPDFLNGILGELVSNELISTSLLATPSNSAGTPVSEFVNALIDANYEAGRFVFNGAEVSTEEAWLASIGGVSAGGVRTIGPFVVGAELLTDPGFASGVDSWADAPTYAANGELSQVSGALRALFTGAATQYRARRPITVVSDRAYLLRATALSHVGLTSAQLAGSTNTDLGGTVNASYALGGLPETKEVVVGPNTTTLYMGLSLNGVAAATSRLDIDDASAKECYPYSNYVVGKVAGHMEFTTPATMPAIQVLAQWGDDSARQRVRFAIGTDFHLRMIITRNNTETGNIDLATLVANTRYELDFSFATNRVVAKVSGNESKQVVSVTLPGIGKLFLYGSWSGEAFLGTIHRFAVWNYERLPRDVFWVEGDSYAAGAAGISLTASLQGLARPAVTTAVAGTTLADQLVRVQANSGLGEDGLFVHWDGSPAGNVDVNSAMANYASILAELEHDRFLIVAPVRLASATEATNDLALAIQNALVAAYGDKVINPQPILESHATSPGDDVNVASDTVPVSLLQGDATHLNATGMGYIAAEVKSRAIAAGW